MIRLGTSADLAAASSVYRRASLSNEGDRDTLLAHPEYLILGPEGLAEGRTHVAEQDGSVVGFATWAEAGGIIDLEDLFVDPDYRRRGLAAALVTRIAEVLRARGAERLEVTANPHAMGFYRAAGFVDCGLAETEFGTAPRMVLVLSLPSRHHQASEAVCGLQPQLSLTMSSAGRRSTWRGRVG
jgi:ribosomal protein S18 acetylase RimI-like enzyme